MFIFIIVLLLLVAVFFFLRDTYRVLTSQRPSLLAKILKRQEKLSKVFWLYGVIGYPVFIVSVIILVFWAGDLYTGVAFREANVAYAQIPQQIFAWYLLAAYRTGWSAAIFLCSANTSKDGLDRLIERLLAWIVACAVLAGVLHQAFFVLSIPSETQAKAECDAMPSVQKELNDVRLKLESDKLNNPNDFWFKRPGYFESALKQEQYKVIWKCTHTLRQPVSAGLLFFLW